MKYRAVPSLSAVRLLRRAAERGVTLQRHPVCSDCGKEVAITNWRAHRAMHRTNDEPKASEA